MHYPGKVIEGKKRKERQAIFAALAANFNVRIINRAEDREGSKREIKSGYIDQLHRLTQFKSKEIDINTGEEKEIKGGLRFLTEEMQGPNNKPELVLLVTDKTEYYNETRVDPYPIFKRNHDGVSQNVCYFNLFDSHKRLDDNGEEIQTPIIKGQKYNKNKDSYGDKSSVLDTILAQLLIKAEVFYEQILVDRACGEFPENYTIVYPHRTKATEEYNSDILDEDLNGDDDEDDTLYQTPLSGYDYCCATLRGDGLEFAIMDKQRLEKIAELLDNSRIYVFGKPYKTRQGKTKYGHDRHPLMIDEKNGHYMIFVSTKAHAMPNHYDLEEKRHALKNDTERCVSREWVKCYVINDNHPERDRTATAKLLKIRDDSGNTFDSFSFNDFSAVRQSLSSAQRSYIYNIILEELSITWHSNLKSSDGNHQVSHQDGFSFSTDANRYFAGRVGSFKAGKHAGFCKIYEIINVGGVPENAHEWFITTSVRNGQTTVYPWLVQHVKEYARMEQFANGRNSVAVATLESPPARMPTVTSSNEDSDIDKEMENMEF
ncbi:hypothetical protein EZMO1_2066 [Endozoicomonas montiporae CL-33]|uniref:Uncharacterized protein n=1 Tax=Endozoicomonas montiporae CL-33 TaxID=570277 RepID=A0A142BBQ9_9GAMM|nr:hypothetical protein EZMO1_2066 [Endozoicomonas montiporae CL-33]